jgi:hypothetical protein
MKKAVFALSLVLVLGALLHAQTLDEVLARHYQARGGLDKLKAIAGWKLSGRMVVDAQGLDLPMAIWQKAPDKMRVETTFQDKKIVQACDGRKAWWIMPFLSGESQAMPADQGKLFCDQAVFEDPLVVFAERGYRLELLGVEPVDGRPAHKLKLVKGDGKEIFYFLDATSGLELKSSRRVKMGESEALAEILYGDYRPAGGLVMPFAIENRLDGHPQVRMTFAEIEIDPVMEDAMFAMPGKMKTPGKNEAPGKKGGK